MRRTGVVTNYKAVEQTNPTAEEKNALVQGKKTQRSQKAPAATSYQKPKPPTRPPPTKGSKPQKKKNDDDESELDDPVPINVGQELTAIRSPISDADDVESSGDVVDGIVTVDVETQPLFPQKPRNMSIDEAIELLGMGRFQFRILIAAGLCFASDSMEVFLLSFLQVVLQVQWKLSNEQAATITSMVFIGEILGTLVLGYLGDRIGRKPAFTMTAVMICFFGFATSSASSLEWLILFRFMVGFGVGGLTVPFDTLSEFLPTNNRGKSLLQIEYFWTAGTLLVPLAAMVTLGPADTLIPEKDEWRYFVALCAIPCLLSSIASVVFVPESPRWLLTVGKHDEAVEVLRFAARCNDKNASQLFPPNTHIYHEEEENTDFRELLSPAWRKTSILLWMTWGGFAFCYYGAIIAVTYVFADENEDDANDGTYSFDYFALLASASAEIAGTTFAIMSVDTLGRVPSQVISYIGGGISVFILCAFATQSTSPRVLLIILSFMVRMFFMTASCVTWVSTAEILTTDVRATGHSAANAMARLCGAISPYVVTKDRPWIVVGTVLMTISGFSALTSGRLPETKGRSIGLKPVDLDSGISLGGKSQESS